VACRRPARCASGWHGRAGIGGWIVACTGARHSSGVGPKLAPADTARFGRLVRERLGLHFPESRWVELGYGVQRAFAVSPCSDLDEYYDLLRDPDSGSLYMQQLVNAVTVCETHFFRDAAQFDALYEHVLPEIIARRRKLRTLRIWSAGCASGEEPYSIAMLLCELLPDVEQWAITVLATDVNTEGLGRARRAVYSDWAFREERAKQWRSRYFRRHGKRYELLPEVRRIVSFGWLNLAEGDWPSFETNTRFMDLVLCRNVTIYLAEAVTAGVIDRFHAALAEGGWLAVGHSEHAPTTYRNFRVHNYPGAILYQRVGRPALLPRGVERRAPCLQDEYEGVAAPAAIPEPAPATTGACRVSRAVSPSLQAELPGEADFVERARELLEYGHSEGARDLLLELPRPDARACSLLGQAFANLGDFREAEGWCRRAIGLDRLVLGAYYTLALVLQHQGDLARAIESMKKVVYINHRHVLGHFGLAELYHGRGQQALALKSLDNAYRLLEGVGGGEIVAGSGGITVGRLRETLVRLQQQWSVEFSGLSAEILRHGAD
jgi:chemotaxis protein methyltransferase CheR